MNKINDTYIQKVELLLNILPLVMDEKVFAVHGGTAINLFLRNLPRFSVDIDLTYIPVKDRETSLKEIASHLDNISKRAQRVFPNLHVVSKHDTSKLLCEYQGKQVKIEVNQIKRGIVGGEILNLPLCEKAQNIFNNYCEAAVVPVTQLYGGKIAAALSRQHPRDLFDVEYMNIPIKTCREGIIYSLLGSDRPINESLSPRLLDQHEAMENQFIGMTDIPFSYEEYEDTRRELINSVKDVLTPADRNFLVGFEKGTPDWENYEFSYLENYPSVKWKSLNIQKIARTNPEKLEESLEKLCDIFNADLFSNFAIQKKLAETVRYATEYATSTGMHRGIRWFDDSFNELCDLFTDINDIDEENVEEVRQKVKNKVLTQCEEHLTETQLQKVETAIEENSYNQEQHLNR